MELEQLIECIRNETILYDFNDKHYHDAERKIYVWREIGRKLNQNPNECKKQWNCLRDSFRRHQKKLKSGQGATNKKWKFQKEMNFLLPFLRERTNISSLETMEMQESQDSEVEDEPAPQVIFWSDSGSDESSNEEKPLENRASKRKLVEHKQIIPKKEKKEQTFSPSSAVYMDYPSKIEEKDEVEALFYGLAQTVKKLPPYYRALAKAKVSSIVGEIELQSLTTPNSSMHRNSKANQTCHCSNESNISNISTPKTSPIESKILI